MSLVHWPERVIAGAAFVAAGLALWQLVQNARQADREFEGRLAAGRYYSHVAQALSTAPSCTAALAGVLSQWNRRDSLRGISLKAELPVWNGADSLRFDLEPVGKASANLWVNIGAFHRRVPLRLDGGCEFDPLAVRGEVGSGWKIGPDCVETYDYGQVKRCPDGHFLTRQIFPYELKCCPLKP